MRHDNLTEAALLPQQAEWSKYSNQFSSGNNPLLHSKREAARLLSISLRKLDDLIAIKELPVRRIGRRVLITHQALLQFIRHDHN